MLKCWQGQTTDLDSEPYKQRQTCAHTKNFSLYVFSSISITALRREKSIIKSLFFSIFLNIYLPMTFISFHRWRLLIYFPCVYLMLQVWNHTIHDPVSSLRSCSRKQLEDWAHFLSFSYPITPSPALLSQLTRAPLLSAQSTTPLPSPTQLPYYWVDLGAI